MHSLLALIKTGVREQKAYRVAADPAIRVKINQNENPFDWPAAIKEDLLAELGSVAWNRYPNDQPIALISALAARLGVSEDAVLIGNGSNELTMNLGAAIVGPGTSVVLPEPMFSLYDKMVRINGGQVVTVEPTSDFQFDADRIVDAIRTNDPHLTVVCSPNNPSGRILAQSDLLRIVEAAKGFVLVDEAYVEFVGDGSGLIDALASHPNLLLMRTFSKAFGLAGLRIGYLVGHPEIIQTLMKARLPFMIDRFAERIAVKLLEYPEIVRGWVDTILAETATLYLKMSGMKHVTVLPTDANFLLFKTPVAVPELMNRLAEMGILIRDMGGYNTLRGYARVSTGTPKENEEFLDALAKVLSDIE